MKLELAATLAIAALALSGTARSQVSAQAPPSAELARGYAYATGWGVSQSYAKVAYWWEKAATQGYADAQYNLGISYLKGQGVPQDYRTAYMWFDLAAAQGLSQAAHERDMIGLLMTNSEINEA